MSSKLSTVNKTKPDPLRKMVGKKVKVLTEGGWVGPVIDVLDRENILVLKNGKTVKANIFDVRSL